ncbi:MAG: MipA/OmpV family protein [Psychrobium sp.]
MAKLFGLAALFLLSSFAANAQDGEEEKSKDSDKWHWDIQFQIGGIFYEHPLKGVEQEEFIDYLGVGFVIDMYYKGFFVQSNQRRSNPAEIDIGYELYERDDWAVDVILKNFFDDMSQDYLEDAGFEHLESRDGAMGVALRYSHYLDDALLTVDVASVLIDEADNGWAVESFYSHLIPYRNWDIYLGTGLTLLSSNVVDYYVGIDKHESRPNLAYYRPGAAYILEAEAHAIYPISEDWTMRIGLTKSYLSDNISDSPLGIRSTSTFVKLGFNYVF